MVLGNPKKQLENHKTSLGYLNTLQDVQGFCHCPKGSKGFRLGLGLSQKVSFGIDNYLTLKGSSRGTKTQLLASMTRHCWHQWQLNQHLYMHTHSQVRIRREREGTSSLKEKERELQKTSYSWVFPSCDIVLVTEIFLEILWGFILYGFLEEIICVLCILLCLLFFQLKILINLN